jgi:predicted dehydrogenase
MEGMRDPINVGVLGTGWISQVAHLPILREREDTHIVAVSDADSPKAHSIAERFDVDRVMSVEALLSDPEVEAVIICTPNHLHEEQAVAALEAGKHVLVERPLATSAAGVERIVEAASRAKRTVAVGMAHRFRPDVSALCAFVTGDELGPIHAVRGAWLNRKTPIARKTWRQNPEEAGGGVLMDLGVQVIDLCLWLVGYPPIVRVSACTRFGDFEVEDAATLFFESENGIAFTVEVSWSLFSGEDQHYARVMGREGTGSLPPLSVFKQMGGRPIEVTPRQPVPRGRENAHTNAYRRELDTFVRTVVGEGAAPPPVEQAILMSLIEAAYRSAREQREVVL